ncbi:MAG: isoaspartyl peptidase/L-asparaginase [Calditrichaeota bacterium]|nr:MAG: isoaspartyl peptidase/L-asparaginase [Calditrichota bacterium]
MKQKFSIAIHGGAGTILREKITKKTDKDYREGLHQSITAGIDILKAGGSALDACTAAVIVMEDSELFNAGKGSVFTNEGTNEMDASIMDGKSKECGAISCVKTVRNPILLAKLIMEKSNHVHLSGEGAEKFAEMHGLAFEDKDYFFTKRRWFQLQTVLAREKEIQETVTILDHDGDDGKHGTVGCVALDNDGNLAAATSSGGMTNKKFNRVGDTPVIGAGNYADNDSCAVSATGHGEYVMRLLTAYDVSAMMLYKNMSLKDSSANAIDKLSKLGGSGGIIAIDKNGTITMPMNTPGMYRASCTNTETEPNVKIFADE